MDLLQRLARATASTGLGLAEVGCEAVRRAAEFERGRHHADRHVLQDEIHQLIPPPTDGKALETTLWLAPTEALRRGDREKHRVGAVRNHPWVSLSLRVFDFGMMPSVAV